MGRRNWTQVLKFSSKYVYLLSHLFEADYPLGLIENKKKNLTRNDSQYTWFIENIRKYESTRSHYFCFKKTCQGQLNLSFLISRLLVQEYD